MKKHNFKNEKGITLITLVVTIIVLLILVGISITGISGNNGMIDKSADARVSAEVNSEMKLIEVASNSARSKNRYGDITIENMQKELSISTGTNKIEVTEELYEDEKIGYKIVFLDSKRCYFIYHKGEDAEIIYAGVEGKNNYSGIIHAKHKKNKVIVNTSEKVEILLRLFSNIDSNNIVLSYGWSKSSYKEPDSYFEAAINGSGNDKTAQVNYPNEIGNYYLYVKAKINNEEEISKVFGEYEVVEEGATIVAAQYTVIYEKGDNILNIGARYDTTTGEVKLPSIIAKSGFKAVGWFEGNNYLGMPGDVITVNRNITLKAEAQDSNAPMVKIARVDYNTFSWEARDKEKITGYKITDNETAPLATDSGWTTTGIITSGTYDISNKSTYYVYVKDESGNVGKASINTYLVTKVQGEGTTLIVKADGVNGVDLANEMAVLEETEIYVSATANNGYNTVILKNGTKRLNENGDKVRVNSTTTIVSTANKEDNNGPTIIVAKVDYNTFRWEANDDNEITGYQILLNPTEAPLATGTGWTTTGTLTEGTYDISTFGTYYVYVKDSKGNVGGKSISAYTINRTQGTNTTLTVIADSVDGSQGTTLNSNTAVLKDTEIWTDLKADTGYTGVLKINGTVQNSTETTIIVDSLKTIESSATANTYTIRFNKNNNNVPSTSTMANQTMTYNKSKNLNLNTFAVPSGTTENQLFIGWNTAANGSGTSYTDGQSVSNLTATNGATIDLYAQWQNANYEVSSPLAYTSTLADAVSLANTETTIKLLRDYSDSSTVSISKNITIDVQDKTLTRASTITITGGAKVTFAGTGAISMPNASNNSTYLIQVENSSKIIKNGTALWSSKYGTLLVRGGSSSCELNGGYLTSSLHRTIYIIGTSATSLINSTNVYANSVSDNAIFIDDDNNRVPSLTIKGTSKIGHGMSGTAANYAVIHFSSPGGILTLAGSAGVYTSSGSYGAIGVAETSIVNISENSSIYCNKYVGNNNQGEACVWFNTGTTLNINTSGCIYSRGNLVFMWGTESIAVDGTIKYTHGNIKSRITNNMYCKNGQVLSISGTSSNTITADYITMTGYNTTSITSYGECYYVNR